MRFILTFVLLSNFIASAQVTQEIGLGGGMDFESNGNIDCYYRFGYKKVLMEVEAMDVFVQSPYSNFKEIRHASFLIGAKTSSEKNNIFCFAFGLRYLYPLKNPKFNGYDYTKEQSTWVTKLSYNRRIKGNHFAFANIFISNYKTNMYRKGYYGIETRGDIRFNIGYSYVFGPKQKRDETN